MEFDGAGLGLVPLGGIVVDVNVSDDSYSVTANLRSRGLLNLFERTNLRAQSTGVIRNNVVFWRTYDLDHHYSQKHRVIAMRVGEDGSVTAEITPNYRLWGDPATTDEQRRRSRDPLSSMIAMGMDVAHSRRCAGAYSTFDGRFHYLLELSGGRIENFRASGFEGEALRCTLSYIAVAGFERRDAGRRRIPHGRVWFGLVPGSNFAPVVRITTPLAAGGAVIRLSDFRRAEVDIAAEP
jgi:hypothetical protein